MINNIKNFENTKNSNLYIIVEKSEDIQKISDFINENIQKNLLKKLDSKENYFLTYFIGNETFENIFVSVIAKKHDLGIVYNLCEDVKKIPKECCVISNKEENLKDIIKSVVLGNYNFDDFLSKTKKQEYFFLTENENEEKIFKKTKKLIKNIILARDLGNTPSNFLYPKTFVEKAQSLEFKNTKIKVLDFEDIQKQKLGLLEAVGKGSIHKPRFLILEKISNPEYETIAFIGKGITFDTGGIQVKPGDSMYEMKGDMCGAASVLAIAKELDKKDLKINIIYVMPLAESHISGRSFKPSDIIRAYNGKTVDIIHTDAEGRLVLADAVSYASKNYKLSKIVTIATLTGACLHAGGFRYAGIMGTDKELIKKFIDYSQNNTEKYFELPFDSYHIEKTKSQIADYKNLTQGMFAGTTMGGAFLINFLENEEKFTHIDIAGTAMNSYEPYAYFNKGMTGFSVESISHIFENL